MISIDENLFETYGVATLRELNCGFNEREIENWMNQFPLNSKERYRLKDDVGEFYFRWASASFSVGFRLGLTLLLSDDICRPRPEQA